MNSARTMDLRETFVYGIVALGAALLAIPLVFLFPFALMAIFMSPLTTIVAALAVSALGFCAVRWRSRILAVIFLIPCAAPAAFLAFCAVEPIYVPHVFEPTEVLHYTAEPSFQQILDTAANRGESWVRDPREVARKFVTGESQRSSVEPVYVFLRHPTESASIATVLSNYTGAGRWSDYVQFERINLTRTPDYWLPTSFDVAWRTKYDFTWRTYP